MSRKKKFPIIIDDARIFFAWTVFSKRRFPIVDDCEDEEDLEQ